MQQGALVVEGRPGLVEFSRKCQLAGRAPLLGKLQHFEQRELWRLAFSVAAESCAFCSGANAVCITIDITSVVGLGRPGFVPAQRRFDNS